MVVLGKALATTLVVVAMQLGCGRSAGVVDVENSLKVQAWNIKMFRETNDDGGWRLRATEEEDDEGKSHIDAYPETQFLRDKDESGICLSGGGSRAYVSSVGYVRGLLDLDLMNATRYISSVSGGSWFNMAYSFYQRDVVGLSEKDFLGEIVPPQNLTRKLLRVMDKRSARAAPVNKDFVMQVLWKLLKGMAPVDIYPTTVADVFLKPAGINVDAQIAFSRERVEDAIARNPSLEKVEFILPCGGATECANKPFPIANAAILGPKVVAPFTLVDDNYVPIEFNSLYAGTPQGHILRYPGKGDHGEERIYNMSVGGYVETFAFAGKVKAIKNDTEIQLAPPFFGLGKEKYTDTLHNVPFPDRQFGILNITAASSFAPGSILSGSPLLKELDNTMGLETEYWSPITESVTKPIFSQTTLIADSASVENQGFLALLRRRLKEIVVFVHSPTPLRPRSDYNPFTRQPLITDIDPALSCFFGIDHENPSVIENLGNNQVFPRYQFPFLIDLMQKAQEKGTGVVVRQELRTVENAFWGIPADHAVNVTWVYLSRCSKWEEQLPKEVRKHVVPKRNPENPASLPTSGPFANFPHFPTSQLHYSKEQSNLLANLAGWVVHQNEDLFRQALRRQGPEDNTFDVIQIDPNNLQ